MHHIGLSERRVIVGFDKDIPNIDEWHGRCGMAKHVEVVAAAEHRTCRH